MRATVSNYENVAEVIAKRLRAKYRDRVHEELKKLNDELQADMILLIEQVRVDYARDFSCGAIDFTVRLPEPPARSEGDV